jgi:hypothetical protein
MMRQLLAACAGLFAGLIIAGAIYASTRPRAPVLSTEFQLVLLSNGQAFFGRMEQFGTPYPILHDVFYIQAHTDPDTKQLKNSLIKRGKEWHEPDVMILDAQDIVLLEPVSPTSAVAKLIKEAKAQ